MTTQKPKKPMSKSPLEAAYCATWNAMHAAKDQFECMDYCIEAINLCDKLHYSEASMIREKIGEAQIHWGLQND